MQPGLASPTCQRACCLLQGLGHWRWVIVLMFWLTVVLLGVYVQNILLAIVTEAYAAAKDEVGAVDRWFIKVCCIAEGQLAWLWRNTSLWCCAQAKLLVLQDANCWVVATE
jgi:hypothetical protein